MVWCRGTGTLYLDPQPQSFGWILRTSLSNPGAIDKCTRDFCAAFAAKTPSVKSMAQQQLARISILGVGKMGAASARRLAGLGYDVRVWNRSPDKAEALAQTTPINHRRSDGD